jgi:DNA topoisomerase-2
MYGVLKQNASVQQKVSRLASYCSGITDYHHGDMSMEGVITGLAQTFVGKNNIGYLEPIGQFGSIVNPIPSASRYIFTLITKEFRSIFLKEDDLILEHLMSDEMEIEPKFFIPIIPNVLINGVSGIGTGYASKFLNHNPKDLVKYILNKLNGVKKNIDLQPWYKGFTGTIRPGSTPLQWQFVGRIERVNTTTLKIVELPIGMYVDDIVKVLGKLMESGIIKDFDNDTTVDSGYNITVYVPRTTSMMSDDELLEAFKLISTDTMNLTAWLPTGKLGLFDSVYDVIDYFVEFRLSKYEQRRLKLIEKYNTDLNWMKEKIRFIKLYIANSKKFSGLKKAELRDYLINEQKFSVDHVDNLLDIKIYNLTKDNIEKLEDDIKKVTELIDHLKNSTSQSLYIEDLKNVKL